MLSPVENKFVQMMAEKVNNIRERRTINTQLEEYSEFTFKKLLSTMIEAESHLYLLKGKIHSLSKVYLWDVFNIIVGNNKGYFVLEDVRHILFIYS